MNATTTSISASPTTLVANGVTTSTITVQAKDANGNDLTTSGGAVTLHPTIGTIGPVTNNNNGTYTATFTSSTATGTSIVTGTIGGNAITTTPSTTIALTAGPVSATMTTISASPTTLVANGVATSTVTVQAKDTYGNDLSGSGGAVTLHPTVGTIGTITDNGNGTYTATFTSATATGDSFITGTIGGNAITGSASVSLTPGTVSAARTAISTSPTTLVANGSTQSTVTVQAKDANGNDLTTSGGAVTLHPTLGTIGTVINNNDGTYTATFTSSTTAGMSTITGTIGGTAMTASTAIMLTSSPTPPAAPAGATSSASGTSDTSGGTATASIPAPQRVARE